MTTIDSWKLQLKAKRCIMEPMLTYANWQTKELNSYGIFMVIKTSLNLEIKAPNGFNIKH